MHVVQFFAHFQDGLQRAFDRLIRGDGTLTVSGEVHADKSDPCAQQAKGTAGIDLFVGLPTVQPKQDWGGSQGRFWKHHQCGGRPKGGQDRSFANRGRKLS